MGATVTIINATTAAVADKQTIDARWYESVVFAAPGLAGAEEVDIYIGGGAAWGVAGKLTASAQTLTLPGAMYGIAKDATVASVPVEATLLGEG